MVRSSLVALAGLALVAWLAAACGGGGGAEPTATASPETSATATPPSLATPTPVATVTPEVIDGVEVVPLQVGQEAELPNDIALIIETGCFSCDGPTTGLVRVYRDTSGQLRTDTLLTAEAVGLPPRGVSTSKEGTWAEEPYIHGFALNSDASEIVVSVCSRGYCQWLGWASPDAELTLFRSLDGGVTWTQFGVLDGSSRVVAVTQNGVLLWSRPAAQAEPSYRLFPGGAPVQPPPEAGEAWPLSLPSGELIWPTDDGRLLRSDGTQFFDVGQDVTSVNMWRMNIQLDPGGEQLAIVWRTQGPGQTGQDYLGVGTTDGTLTRVFSLGEYAGVGGWVDSKLLVGNASFTPQELGTTDLNFFGYLPALFNLDMGQAQALTHPFLGPPLQGQRNHIQAVLRGPFARVVNTGACLNVRAEPAMAAPVLACAADGVLLRDTGETREVDGVTWRRVVTPAGVEGWASTQYLER